MKIGGVEVSKCEVLLVLPRPNGDDIPFVVKPADIEEEFEKKSPAPIPPRVTGKGGKSFSNTKDEDYLQAMEIRKVRRFALLAIRSLEPSDIEWEEVDYDKPGTWEKWTDELLAAGMSDREVQRVIGAVMEANSLDNAKIDAARAAFLQGPEEPQEASSGQTPDPPTS
jgi:hypothetical protein